MVISFLLKRRNIDICSFIFIWYIFFILKKINDLYKIICLLDMNYNIKIIKYKFINISVISIY